MGDERMAVHDPDRTGSHCNLIKIFIIQIILPAIVTLGISERMRKKDGSKMVI